MNFPTKHLRAISVSILSSAQFNQLNDYLLQHWGFNARRVDFTPLEPFNFPDSMTQDIGKTALILLFCACLIGTLSLILPKFQGLHFGIESYF